MKVIEAIGKGFGVAGKNLGILAVLFVFNLLWNLVPLLFLGGGKPAVNLGLTLQILILTIIFILINIFIQGGLFGILKDAIASDEKAVLTNLTKYAKKFYLRFLGLGLVVFAGIGLAALIIGLIFSISLVVKNIIASVAAAGVALILVAIALYYLFLLFLSPYVLVIEDAAVFKAMGDSLRFTKNNLLKMLGLVALLLLIALGIGFIVGIASGILSFALKGTAFQILTSIITSAVNAYITVIISAAFIAYYSAHSGAAQKKEAV